MTVQAAEASQKNEVRFDILPCQPPAGLLERIAREQGWSSERTQLAWGEYLRFCVLAVARGGHVSPSHAIDAVWHAHLLFTQDYWGRFCGRVLAFELHHVPATGGGDTKAFARVYEATRTAYESTFGIVPPVEFWPAPGTPHGNERVVDDSAHWIIPKPSQATRRGLATAAVIACCLGLLAVVFAITLGAGLATPHGATFVTAPAQTTPNIFNWTGGAFLGLVILVYPALFICGLMIRRVARRAPGHASPEKPLDAYALAMLSGRERLTASAVVASLAARGAVTPSGDKVALADGVEPATFRGEEIERVVVYRLASGSQGIATLTSALESPLRQIKLRLIERGLLVDPATSSWSRVFATLITLLIPAISVIKIAVGVARHKPVGYLVVLVFIGTIVSLVAFLRPLHRTVAGDEVLRRMRRENNRATLAAATSGGRDMGSSTSPRQATAMAGGFDPLVLGLALYGTGMLAATPYADFRRALHPPGSSDSGGWSGDSSTSSGSDAGGSSDSGGGDSGGGGDGGGSGCGGCGGGGGD